MPQRRATSSLIAVRFSGSTSLSSFGTEIHCSPRRLVIRTPGTPLVQGPLQPFQPGRHPCAQIGDELGRIQRLTQRGVLDLAGLLEITRQVVFRVAPPVAALDVDFAPSQRVTQRDQHAQLVRYALDPVAVVDHSFTPGFRDHAVQRHQGVLVVEADLAVDRGIARQQLPSSCRGCASNGYGWSR